MIMYFRLLVVFSLKYVDVCIIYAKRTNFGVTSRKHFSACVRFVRMVRARYLCLHSYCCCCCVIFVFAQGRENKETAARWSRWSSESFVDWRCVTCYHFVLRNFSVCAGLSGGKDTARPPRVDEQLLCFLGSCPSLIWRRSEDFVSSFCYYGLS